MGILVSYRDAIAEDVGTPYSLTLNNQSAEAWTFYVYQKPPTLTSNIFSLAWFASPFLITPGSQIIFTWDIFYNFIWGNTGTIMPGVTFTAGGTIDADPAGANTTTFSIQPGPNLSPASQVPPSGSLIINDSNDVPNNEFSVGIGMSGTGTYAVQAGANLTHIFTPTPSYWVAAGQDVRVGTVLDIQTITTTAEVSFPVNQFNATGTLDQSNTWTFVYS
jgi:rhizosphere induced protein